ncbi:HET-domain-containing protein [Pilatotrama ljubarskyi]|nr:HET-domain-containing protein [Pilatotrama ljubarskyi]
MGCFDSLPSLKTLLALLRNMQGTREDIAATSVDGSNASLSLTQPPPTDGNQSLCVTTNAVSPEVARSAVPLRPPSICSACWEGLFSAHLGLLGERLDRSSPDISGGYAYSTSRAELESRGGAGCRWCRLLLSTRPDGEDPTSIAPFKVVVGDPGPGELRRECTPAHAQGLSVYINGRHAFSGYVYTTSDDPAALYIIARSPVLDVGSPRALALAKACVEQCVHGHERCSAFAVSKDVPLPTRLIDCSDASRPCLASTSGTFGAYLALSYVWGEAQPHRTTMSNISAYRNGIDASRLPQTIRDALRVTHALGFRYLWVDSLCIIQDSDEDKRRELGGMRRIYRDAYLTIIASCAQRVGEGFLQDRPPVQNPADDVFSRDFTLPFVCPRLAESDPSSPRLAGTVHISPVSTSADPFGYGLLPHNPALEPISSRGWCMQEYFMSSRALLFTSRALLFRCQTTTLSIGGAFYDTFYDRRLPDVLFLREASPATRGSEEWATVRWAWQVTMQDYTRRAITVPSDKLVACAGIAEEYSRVFRSEYLAGLWRDTLLEDLLWRKRATLLRVDPHNYRAPSWSWASVEGELLPGTPEVGQALAEVVECEVTLEDSSLPFGQVTGATLVLRAALVSCVLEREDGTYRMTLRPSDDERRADAPTTMLVGAGTIDCEQDEGFRIAWAIPLWGREGLMEGVVVLPVRPCGSQNEQYSKEVFRRIGYVRVAMPREPKGLSAVRWVSEQRQLEIELE